jgi:hypothetical protein|tara:strand:+ start:4245 stop:5207 length:963 start_codon:yes stop_codon:yes gene_type:complete
MSVTPSAIANWTAQTGTASAEQYPDVLNSRFDQIARREWDEPIQGLDMWNVRTTGKDAARHSYVASGGVIPQNRDVDRLPRQQPIQGFDNTYAPVGYRMAMWIEKRLLETQQFDVVDKQMADLNRSARLTVELYAALPFNTTFDSSVDWVCADGLRLIDSARNREDKAGGTWTNLETGGVPTQARVGQMRLNFRKNKDEFGDPAPLTMNELIIPPDLEDTVIENLESAQQPGTALNNKNFLTKYNLSYKVWDYLTSSTAWFGRAPKDSLYELYWYWGSNPAIDVTPVTYSSNPDVMGNRLRMFMVSGADRPHSVRGNAGA